jgi:hypothetical protein
VDESVTALNVKALQTHIPDRQVFAHFVGGGGWNVLDRAAQVIAGKLALEIVSLTNSSSLGADQTRQSKKQRGAQNG